MGAGEGVAGYSPPPRRRGPVYFRIHDPDIRAGDAWRGAHDESNKNLATDSVAYGSVRVAGCGLQRRRRAGRSHSSSGAGDDTCTFTGSDADHACTHTGSDSDPDDACAASASAAAEPVIFSMVFPSIPSNIDPAVYEGRPTGETTQSIVSTLVRYAPLAEGASALQGPTDLIGELAESWERDADGNYVFVLRNAQSPAGNTVTSADVLWSFERRLETDFISPFLLLVGGIDQTTPIEVIDDRTFKLIAPGANSLTVAVLTWYGMGIIDSVEALSHATVDDPWAKEWLATNSASFGPYQVASMTPSEEIRLVKNPNYWNAAAVQIDEVVMRAVPDNGSRMLLIGAREVDFVGGLTYELLDSVIQTAENVVAIAALDVNLDKLSLNTRFAPFDDVRVRQAVSMAIDRTALIEGAYAGFGTPGLYPISTVIPQPAPPASAAASYDPDGARALLAEAGLADGFSFELAINPSSGPGPNAEQIAIIIQAQLREVGIEMSINPIPAPADFSAATRGGELQAWLFGTRPLVNDPAYFLLLAVGPFSTRLEAFASDDIDALLADIVAAAPGADRDALMGQMQQLLGDSVPYVPLVETVLPWVYLGDYLGLNPNPTGAVYLQDVVRQ